MRKLIFKLHLYVALAFGLPIVVIGASGSVLAFGPELRRLLHPGLSRTPQGAVLSLAEITSAILSRFPGERILRFEISSRASEPYQVALLDHGPMQVNRKSSRG